MIQHVGYKPLEISKVRVPDPGRPVDDATVTSLSESIDEVGLIHPIVVTEDHRLICGRHRLEACRRLGWVKIDAFLVTYDDEEDLELAEIDEDYYRKHLSCLEQCELLDRRERLLALKGLRARSGQGRPPQDDEPPSKYTTADVAKEERPDGSDLPASAQHRPPDLRGGPRHRPWDRTGVQPTGTGAAGPSPRESAG